MALARFFFGEIAVKKPFKNVGQITCKATRSPKTCITKVIKIKTSEAIASLRKAIEPTKTSPIPCKGIAELVIFCPFFLVA